MSELNEPLLGGLKQLNMSIFSPELAAKLDAYLLLLHKWNKAYNLTAIRDIHDMVGRHILDSLAVLPWVKGRRVIDLGTGAGLPGVPIALAKPDVHVVLLDSNGKKIRFLHEVKRVLAIPNIEIIQSRAEDYNPDVGFDTVISRAFSNIPDMLHWSNHLLMKPGIWVAMKGVRPENELLTIPYSYRIESYSVAGVIGERCCVIIEK